MSAEPQTLTFGPYAVSGGAPVPPSGVVEVIELTGKDRGDVPIEVTHLKEVHPAVGDVFNGFCFCSEIGEWFKNDPCEGPETENWLKRYRYAVPHPPAVPEGQGEVR